eukprot:CAMPEP_0177741890 /NCGR_PEP_ID=MMETSP0484_2-20121128/28352_1 /TAXON_ID=354590 /ORGANISM="Rhodomonas lens, Strain RHODO" /LENGTH=381 /DNA_ID=CAMNT_0019256153 /DNA_START=145 /DNA_END=1288 /DNA_ORIENTATION=-
MNRANSHDDLYSSARSIDSQVSRTLGGGSGPHMSGVGIFFQQESDGKVYVKTIVVAERDGRVRVGDVMCGVDGRDVIGEPVSVLRSLLLGHEGSAVVLTFARAVEAGTDGESGDGTFGNTVIAKFDVELLRGSPEYFARMDQSRRYEAEMQDLRQQLKQTLGEEKEIAEEIERVKRVLQLERGASARREKELEDLRASHVRETTALTEACRRAETVRREAIGRLAPVQSREQDMSEELARMKEKDRLRKEYVDELRKRHEDEASRLEAQLSKEQRARREEQAARLEVERELAKARTELRKEMEYQRIIAEQDKVYRDRSDKLKHKMKEMVETMDAANALTRDVEEATANMQDDLASARTAAGSAAAEQAHHRQPAAEHADN